MVSVLLVGTPPKPDKVYVGTFKTPAVKVEDPDDPVVVNEVNVAVGGVGIFNTLAINVAAPVPVVVKLVILFVYAVSQFAWDDVVGIEYPAVKLNTPVVFVYVNPVAVELNDVSNAIVPDASGN